MNLREDKQMFSGWIYCRRTAALLSVLRTHGKGVDIIFRWSFVKPSENRSWCFNISFELTRIPRCPSSHEAWSSITACRFVVVKSVLKGLCRFWKLQKTMWCDLEKASSNLTTFIIRMVMGTNENDTLDDCRGASPVSEGRWVGSRSSISVWKICCFHDSQGIDLAFRLKVFGVYASLEVMYYWKINSK